MSNLSANSTVSCPEPDCGGAIAPDGYCDTCGVKYQGQASPPGPVPQPSFAAAAPKATGSVCGREGCVGTIAADGYCDTCGLAADSAAGSAAVAAAGGSVPVTAPAGGEPSIAVPRAPDISTAVSVRGDSSTPTRRESSSRRTGSRRTGIGAGLVTVAPTQIGDPAQAVMTEADVSAVLGEVPEDERFCSSCGKAVGRSTAGQPGRVTGFCGHCRTPFDFITNAPGLKTGELVAGQYEILGPLAHGGMGWIYLGRDRAVSNRWVVLKGLLNEHDPDAIAAAVAERRFLAQIEHANIVNIYNFVTHRGAGYIVMEMVGGESLNAKLKKRRAANGGVADPLPVTDAIAYILGVLPAFSYLHGLGLVYNDLKPANIMAVGEDVKLIDVGAVMRIDDPHAAIFGTEGFQAPEMAHTGPSVASDLYTIGRTLAVLVIRFVFHTGTHQYTLPGQDAEPLFAQWESLYRFLLKATAAHPDDRFQSAAEMQEQLTGVLREIVAISEAQPRAALSTEFEPDRLSHLLLSAAEDFDATQVDWRVLPPARIDDADPAAPLLLDLPENNPEVNLATILAAAESGQVDRSRGLRLRSAWELIQLHGRGGSVTPTHAERLRELGGDTESILDGLEAEDPWDWRVWWYRSIHLLQGGQAAAAAEGFSRVWTELPGETAPKVGVALAAEAVGQLDRAQEVFDLVSRSDPGFVSAAFGLARCNIARSRVADAVDAFGRVPSSSAAHYEAQVAAARTLAAGSPQLPPTVDELSQASSIIDRLELDAAERASISADIFEQALDGLAGGRIGSTDTKLLGREISERDLRKGLEEAYRFLARLAPDATSRTALIDRANRVRPWSLL
ncbi:MAG: serine/threonine-protein kinase PknG [Acidimicrobiia bacterium]|nr:serine/threonine-protein kinase PknG [Acidimicrobiia bacterium]